MLEFTRDGASGGSKDIVWTENEKNRVQKSLCRQALVDFQFGVSNIYHKPGTFLRRTQTGNKVELIFYTQWDR